MESVIGKKCVVSSWDDGKSVVSGECGVCVGSGSVMVTVMVTRQWTGIGMVMQLMAMTRIYRNLPKRTVKRDRNCRKVFAEVDCIEIMRNVARGDIISSFP